MHLLFTDNLVLLSSWNLPYFCNAFLCIYVKIGQNPVYQT